MLVLNEVHLCYFAREFAYKGKVSNVLAQAALEIYRDNDDFASDPSILILAFSNQTQVIAVEYFYNESIIFSFRNMFKVNNKEDISWSHMTFI